VSSSSSVARVHEQNGCAKTRMVWAVRERSREVPMGQCAGLAISAPAVALKAIRAVIPVTVAVSPHSKKQQKP